MWMPVGRACLLSPPVTTCDGMPSGVQFVVALEAFDATHVRKEDPGMGHIPGDWRGWSLTAVYALSMGIMGAILRPSAGIAMGILTVAFVAFAIWAFVNEI